MDGSPNIALPESHWRWRVLLWAAIATAFTAWSIQYSFEHGRLIGTPGFDDVVYFCDGLDRLEELRVRGWRGVIGHYFKNPPHSPFSTTLAAASFGLFGVQDWAPYAGNGIIIFMLLAFTDCLLIGARPWIRIAGLALVLTVPLTQKAVIEFRPDVAVALLTAMGVILAVTRSLVASSFRYQLLVGLVFGTALVVKPTMCVLTGFLCGLSLGVAILCDWYLHRPTYRKLLGTYALTGLITILVAAPYYLCNGEHVARYIYRNMFGSNAATWQLEATLDEHLLFYLTGNGAIEMLDNTTWILSALLVAGAMYLLVRRDKEKLVRAAALSLCIAGAYAVPTASLCKHGFYGLAFHSLLLFASILSLREIYRHNVPVRAVWRWGTIAALVIVAGVSLWRHPHVPIMGTRGDSNIGSTRSTCTQIVAYLAANQQEANSIVFSTSECRYSHAVILQWIARRDAYALKFTSVPFGSGLDAYPNAMRNADFVIAIETDNPSMRFASERMASEILALARSTPSLVEMQSFPSYDGVIYHVFKNTQASFTGFKKTKNLGPIEGPYTQWDLPRVRWGFGKQTHLTFEAKQQGPFRLRMSCRAGAKDQAITVRLDGQEIFSQELEIQQPFTSIDVPLSVATPGEHEVVLEYRATDMASDARSLAVLFERLQIAPAANTVP